MGAQPDRVKGERERRGELEPSLALFRPLAAYLVPVGIVILAIADSPWWVGVALIVSGAVITQKLGEDERRAESN